MQAYVIYLQNEKTVTDVKTVVTDSPLAALDAEREDLKLEGYCVGIRRADIDAPKPEARKELLGVPALHQGKLPQVKRRREIDVDALVLEDGEGVWG